MLGVCYLVMVVFDWQWWLVIWQWVWILVIVCGSVCMEILLKFLGLWCVNVVVVVVSDLWVVVVQRWWWWLVLFFFPPILLCFSGGGSLNGWLWVVRLSFIDRWLLALVGC